jgi:hypothetical protein
MKLVGLMMVRNEAWVLGLTLRAAMMWCDTVYVLDHGSTDGTTEIIEECRREYGSDRLQSIRHESEHWDEMDVRHRMLESVRKLGATHIAIIDADEALTGNLLGSVRMLFDTHARGEIITLPMVSTYHSIARRRVDGVWGERGGITLGFVDQPKLAWKPADDGYQYHARAPHGSIRPELSRRDLSFGGVFHLQFVSLTRLRAKAVWYKMMEMVRYPGRKSARELNAMYDWTLDEGDLRCTTIPNEWWAPYAAHLGRLDVSSEPWHTREAKRLLEAHGASRFSGLNLHGVL